MSKVGDDIVEGMKQALAHARGEDVPSIKIHHIDPKQVDVESVIKTLNLTKRQAADLRRARGSGGRKHDESQ